MSFTDEDSNQSTATTLKSPVTPRLCHLKKWPHFQGYGFNLHAERAKTGQHIGKVDADSPAESAGLLEGDRIIEVNGVNISNENHQQVVKRIRNGLEVHGKFYDDEVVLLVLDSEADAYYRSKSVVVKADFKEVLRLSTRDLDENNNIKVGSPDTPLPAVTKITLSDSTNTQQDSKSKLVSNSLSSVSQKSQFSEAQNETENLRTVSASSLGIDQISRNKELVSSASNLSVSSNNQSNSSKATTPNVQTKNIANSYIEEEAKQPEVDIYEQSSISRLDGKSNVKSVDPFPLSDACCSNKPTRPPPPKPQRNMSETDAYVSYYFKKGHGIVESTQKTRSKSTATSNELTKYLEMSACEFKSYLKSKSRADPRIAQVDMRQKYQMFQDM